MASTETLDLGKKLCKQQGSNNVLLSIGHVAYTLYRVGNVPLIYPIADKGFTNIYVMLGSAVFYSLWGRVGQKVFTKAEETRAIAPITMFITATLVLCMLVIAGGFIYLSQYDRAVCEVVKKEMIKNDAKNWVFDDHAECFGAGYPPPLPVNSHARPSPDVAQSHPPACTPMILHQRRHHCRHHPPTPSVCLCRFNHSRYGGDAPDYHPPGAGHSTLLRILLLFRVLVVSLIAPLTQRAKKSPSSTPLVRLAAF